MKALILRKPYPFYKSVRINKYSKEIIFKILPLEAETLSTLQQCKDKYTVFLSLHFCSVDKVSALVPAISPHKTAQNMIHESTKSYERNENSVCDARPPDSFLSTLQMCKDKKNLAIIYYVENFLCLGKIPNREKSPAQILYREIPCNIQGKINIGLNTG